MLFNSVEFCVFLPVVFVLYWYVFRWSVMARNMVLFGASMFFYAWWDWRFLGLVFYSAGIDYVVALWLERTDSPRKRKLLLLISLVTNLGLLGFFKYFNFFITSLDGAFTFFGHPLDMHTLRIVLPVGISFYTFQSLSYTIDVYRRQLNACHQPLIYFPFVLFFPQLMAGPIERAHHLMPQFKAPKLLDPKMVASGLRLAAWGMFKKVVIADRIAAGVNAVYDTPTQHSGLTLLLATVLFAIQIYCDFSGYSDIAVGAARLFGFDLMKNFRSPYNSRSIAEFWKRWHISLSSWFRDYQIGRAHV